MNPIIEVNNLSKQYRLGTVGTGSLSHDINRWWHKLRGKEDPYLKIGQTNDRTQKGEADYVWALRDINFTVQPGEVLGIIGRNGAGKSTLLKVLSRITAPTMGSVTLRGRVASLLEVGTGMHPELTGRENIYLNGAILGMRKKEIDRKLDAIVDFAGVERYLDTPVKRYSSGMHVRLGFAVAANLEPDILIVDEVLAVGDAEFQKKCIGKMQDVSRGEGRTVLFVSHNMASVKALCQKAMILTTGQMEAIENVDLAVNRYLQGGESETANYREVGKEKDGFTLLFGGIKNEGKAYGEPVTRDHPIQFTFGYCNHTAYSNLYINIKMKDEEGRYFLTTSSGQNGFFLKNGQNEAVMTVPGHFFNEGSFYIDVMVIGKEDRGYHVFFDEKDMHNLQILPDQREFGVWMGREKGQIRMAFDWTT